jgi:hypothetical protein
VAATERPRNGALLAAALSLPGVLPAGAIAQTVPENGVVQFTYLGYRDWQPGADRMTVRSPALHVMAPFAEKWVVEGNLVYDAMSGASPLYFNTLSRATITDYRTAGDVRATRYFERWSLGAGGGYSGERDYISRFGSVDLKWWTADKNTTLAFGFGGASDLINPVNQVVIDATRDTLDFLAGVTHNLSPTQAIQSNLTYSTGHGYYSDPYKTFDTRPDARRIVAWLTRYNQYFPDGDGTLKLAYRYLHDSFGASSNMLEAAWNQPLPHGFSVQPNLRYLSQAAASFYENPPFPTGYRFGNPYTADTRLASWGAVTIGAWLVKSLADGWTVDLKYQYYRQQPGWRLGGSGSPGIERFMASWWQFGIGKAF